jgi:hypothetical protein
MSRTMLLLTGFILICLIGCGSTTNPAAQAPPPDQDAMAKYLLSAEPADAKSVVETKTSAKDGEEITLVGRIGGSQTPFVSDRASFTIVDTALIPCSEKPGESCRTPWDYCCDLDQLPKATAMVKVVDADGQTVPLDAKRDLGMQELQTVIVKGTAKRDEAGNLTVLTPAVYVKK